MNRATPRNPGQIFIAVVSWAATVGAGIVFLVFIARVCWDVRSGTDPVEEGTVASAIAVSLSLTFGSALVAWFGLSERLGILAADGSPLERFFKWLFSVTAACLLAMALYLIAGGIAGLTYVTHSEDTPTWLVGIAAGWAGQMSAIISSTLAKNL